MGLIMDIRAIEEARDTYGPSNCWTGTTGKLATYLDQLLKEREQYVGPRLVVVYNNADIVVKQDQRPHPEAMDEAMGLEWERLGQKWALRHKHWSVGLMPAECLRDRFWKIYQFVHHTFPRIQFIYPNAEIEFYGRFRCGDCGRDLGMRHSAPDACPMCGRFLSVASGTFQQETGYLEKVLFLHKAYGGVE